MKANGWGRIINITSAHALAAQPTKQFVQPEQVGPLVAYLASAAAAAITGSALTMDGGWTAQ